MTAKTLPVRGHRPEQPTERPKRPAPQPPAVGRATYSDEYVAQLRRDKRDAEERSEHYARLSGHLSGLVKWAAQQLRHEGRDDLAELLLDELEGP